MFDRVVKDKGFIEAINVFKERRLYKFRSEDCCNENEYNELNQEVKEQFNLLRERVPRGEVEVNDIEKKQRRLEALSNELVYERGFKDGVKFLMESLV